MIIKYQIRLYKVHIMFIVDPCILTVANICVCLGVWPAHSLYVCCSFIVWQPFNVSSNYCVALQW